MPFEIILLPAVVCFVLGIMNGLKAGKQQK